MEERVIALVGDVVASREIAQRVAFDQALLRVLRELSDRNPGILSPYTLIGDEIQAVFGSADSLFSDAVSILSAIHPERMRFSFGVGTLFTPINPDQATEMDGPAFHHARDGVNELKQSHYLLHLTGEEIPHLRLMQQILFFVSHHMDTWNENRIRTLVMLRRKLPVKEIAAELEISEPAVYKTIRVGALQVVMSLFAEVEGVINQSLSDRP